jgi:deazaflavin-dependent oxidoreductase (nitroreductase family)
MSEASRSPWPAKRLQQTRGRRIGDAIVRWIVGWNVVPRTAILTTVGRRSGKTRRNPVTWVRRDDRLYLVAPYGPVGWVHNARAAGRVTLSGKGVSGEYAVREVSPEEAGPVLKDYIAFASATRSYFSAKPDAPVEAFVAEAHTHPVFELTPLSG